jgi:hypothetical protein
VKAPICGGSQALCVAHIELTLALTLIELHTGQPTFATVNRDSCAYVPTLEHEARIRLRQTTAVVPTDGNNAIAVDRHGGKRRQEVVVWI